MAVIKKNPSKTEEIELKPSTTLAPAISVSNVDPEASDTASSSSPAASRSTSPASTPPSPGTPVSEQSETQSQDADDTRTCPQPQNADSSNGGSTLVASASTSQNGQSRTPSPAPVNNQPTWRSWCPSNRSIRDRLPGNDGMQNFMALCVLGFTVVTLVYSHRSDDLQRWNNWATFYSWCQSANYTPITCKMIRHKPLPPPPLRSGPSTWKRSEIRLGSSEETRIVPQGRQDALRWDALVLMSYVENAITFATLSPVIAGILYLGVTFVLIIVYVSTKYRQHIYGQKLSDLSMARTAFQATSIALDEPSAEFLRLRKNLRACVSAAIFIHTLKRNCDQHTEELETRRNSSIPWSFRSRHSVLTSSDPSIYPHVEFVWDNHGSRKPSGSSSKSDGEQEPELELTEERWRKIVMDPDFEAVPEGECSHKSSESSVQAGCCWPMGGANGKAHGFATKVRKWWGPAPVTVAPDHHAHLHAGDVRAGMAFVGATMAAAGGGRLLERCPVEIPVDYGSLPDSWMHFMHKDKDHEQ